MKCTFTLIFCSLIFFSGYAQNATISGKIKVANTEASVSDVYVYLDGTAFFDISNANGAFTIDDIPYGKYTLVTSIIGFSESRTPIHINEQSDNKINIRINEKMNDLPLVEVNANNGSGGIMGALNLPGSVHYLSAKELNQFNTTNIHQILSQIPGVQIQEEDGYGLRPNIGLRGTGSERSSKITIMEDGVLAAPAPYAAPSAYYFPNVMRMSGVEVFKGSSQIKYGPYTTGGAINFISTSIPDHFSGSVNLSLGSYNHRAIHANIGNKINNFSFLAEGLLLSTDGFKEFENSDKNTGFVKSDYLIKAKWQSDEDAKVYQSISIKSTQTSENSNETYLGITRTDFQNAPYTRYAASQLDNMLSKQNQNVINYTIKPLKGLYLTTVLYQNNFERNWYKLDGVKSTNGSKAGIASILNDPEIFSNEINILKGQTSSNEDLLILKANNRSYVSKGIQTKINYLSGNHALEVGNRVHYDEMDRYQWTDDYSFVSSLLSLDSPGIPGTESNRIESANAVSNYIKYNYSFKKLTVIAGLRNESVLFTRMDFGKNDPDRTGEEASSRENRVNAWLPGMNVQYNLNQTDQIFGGIHRGFSPPGSTPGTNPEFSINYELGYRLQKNALYSSIVLYRNNYSNLLGTDLASSGGTGSGNTYNGGKSVAQGIEVAVNYRKQLNKYSYVPFSIQYTFTDARFLTNFESDFEPWGTVQINDELPYLAKHTANINTGIYYKRFSSGISANYRGDMRTVAGQGEKVADNSINERILLNLNFDYKLAKATSIQFTLNNLLNTKYIVANRPAGWRPGMPRNFILKISTNF